MIDREKHPDIGDKIKTVAVLGASGTVGSLSGGLMAQNGLKVYFLSRTQEGSERGLQKAIAQARSEMIARNIVCGDYEKMLAEAASKADWVVEAVTEDIDIKHKLYEQFEAYIKPQTIVSSTTSSLPLTMLVQERSDNFKRNFLSTHFYNPPRQNVRLRGDRNRIYGPGRCIVYAAIPRKMSQTRGHTRKKHGGLRRKPGCLCVIQPNHRPGP
jgi:NADPH:quinone reductase-like Zn-dependent oxidoreductase